MKNARMHSWEVALTAAAEADILEIISWTSINFGKRQASLYTDTLSVAVGALIEGPAVPGTKPRDDIAKGIRVLHVARDGRAGRHFLMFRVSGKHARRIEVLRVLHDAMDLARHLS